MPWMSSGDGLDAHQDDLSADLGLGLGLVGREDHLAGNRAGGGRQALGDDVPDGLGVEGGVQQLVELAGGHAQDRGLLVDQSLLDHVDGDLDGSRRGALAVAGLQHVELPFSMVNSMSCMSL